MDNVKTEDFVELQVGEIEKKPHIITTKMAKLLELKSIVTLALVGCTCALAVKSNFQIAPEFFASIVTAVITYYFTRKNSDNEKSN